MGIESDKKGQAHQRLTGTEILQPGGLVRKKIPNSVRSTIRAIRRHWPSDAPPRGLSWTAFAVHFAPTYNEVARRFVETEDKSVSAIAKLIEHLEINQDEAPLHKLLAIAEYLGVPVGVLLLFTHCIGEATSGIDSSSIDNLLEASIAALTAIRQELPASGVYPKSLVNLRTTKAGVRHYTVQIETLRKAAVAFCAVRKEATVQHAHFKPSSR